MKNPKRGNSQEPVADVFGDGGAEFYSLLTELLDSALIRNHLTELEIRIIKELHLQPKLQIGQSTAQGNLPGLYTVLKQESRSEIRKFKALASSLGMSEIELARHYTRAIENLKNFFQLALAEPITNHIRPIATITNSRRSSTKKRAQGLKAM